MILLPTGNFKPGATKGKGGNSAVSHAAKSRLILMGAPLQQGSMQETGTQHREFGSPFIPSHFELPTLKQDVFMFPGRIFHHLYSNPRAGSVPAGQALHSKGERAEKDITQPRHTSNSFENINIAFVLSGANKQRKYFIYL